MTQEQKLVITAPKFMMVRFLIRGLAPLVVERFSKKTELMHKMSEGKAAQSKRVRTARDYEAEAEASRYRDEAEGWEGMNAAAFRCGMISACRLVGYKMTLAKLSLFVEADGWDRADGVPLVRIYGPSEVFTLHTRNATGVVDVRSRPMYRRWAAVVRIRWDAEQFSTSDVLNLLARVGSQVGIGAGRPDSKASAGCGWGLFEVVPESQLAAVAEEFGIALEGVNA
jgi:hypothetical protein